MKKAYIYAFATILMWGTIATMSKVLQGNMGTMSVLAYTFILATLMLAVYNGIKGKLKELFRLPGRVVLKMAAIGSLGVFFCNYTFFRGTVLLPAQQAMVVNYLWPALVVVFSCFILKEKMTFSKGLAIVLSMIGIVIVVTNGNLSGLKLGSAAGIAFCVADAVFYAFYVVLNKREDYDKGLAIMVAYAAASVMAVAWALIAGGLEVPSGRQFLGLAYNGMVCNGLAYLLWSLAIDMGNTAVIANLAYLSPFVSLLVTHFALGERITLWSVVGLLLIVSGILVQNMGKSKEAKA